MLDLAANLQSIKQRIAEAEKRANRSPGSVSLLAVSKSQPIPLIAQLVAAGHHWIGENYLQEALLKISALSNKDIVWHYIGSIQSKKTQAIATHFKWVHTITRLKEASLLSAFRSQAADPLNVCIQIKLDDIPKKTGVDKHEVFTLIDDIKKLPGLHLRGLMLLPPFVAEIEKQRDYFKQSEDLLGACNDNGANLDTLSMGMTHDFEAAIEHGATIVRVGTGLFGKRRNIE